ncbi:MAG TPA: IS1380 family transposase [Phycisphaerales bacterium]|nr:IS1380 family transposase [Phycisphaerales bacterium]HBR20657.1 IS1380 family transposase [Phycisphaerales bacterium]
METQCNEVLFDFQGQNRRDVVAKFGGGTITTDGGALLLREVEHHTGIIAGFSACFTDHRNPRLIEHALEHLIAQRIYALALGYEDLNDHDQLRNDPLLAVLAGKDDPTGTDRTRARDKGKALAGKSTLNRLELTPISATGKSRYKKIAFNRKKADNFFVDVFVHSHDTAPLRIVLDLDATDDIIHGNQSGRFFHGYYGNYCYLPLYIFCGEHLPCARLRPSDIDASAGSVKEIERIVKQIRISWPKVQIIVRGDSGFCREHIMCWCENNNVDYIFGLAKNERLTKEIAQELANAQEEYTKTGKAARVFKDFTYQTLDSWSCSRRVVGKAERLEMGANPRFVVTSLPKEAFDGRSLYEDMYCARGDMENRIKEQQLCLFADRTSAATMRANQLRLLFSSVAYTLMTAMRRLGLKNTELANTRCDTIRLKLLKIGAQIKVTVRKVWVSLSQSWPYREIFAMAYHQLRNLHSVPLRC